MLRFCDNIDLCNVYCRLGQNVPKKTSEQDQVDVNTLHRALFKTSDGVVTKPVTFTVKI